MKDEYISSIENAGFIEVKVINEVRIPFDFDIEDATVKEIIKNIDIKPEDMIRIKEDNKDAIASISVYGEKPLK